MNLKNLASYEIIEQRPVPDLNSEGAILRHKKTGARIVLLSNDDTNKVFYIGFRTPPTDSTGVAHIIEHSVLCGSDKYPVKDPFIELAKGSLNTFLNAMTYPDKTVYPVASCNDKDFANLCDVYLDAVFHPHIYSERKIFEQEGWHYEVDEEGNLIYNGVVYNEMKGAYSAADDVLMREIMNELFPDTAYGVDSGGKPENIPDLTYEVFLEFHRKYYHPSNSYIYLYGNMDMEERLAWLDEAYLSSYDSLSVDSALSLQKTFDKAKNVTKRYPVLESDERDNLHYFSYTVASDKVLDPTLYAALDVLDYALCSAPGAPVKVALLEAGIGEDNYSIADGGLLQPFFSFVSKNARADEGEKFVSVIEDTLRKLAEEGLDKESLLAAINLYAFRYKEADFGSYPKGLMYGLQALDSWLYDDTKPFMYIEANETFDRLRSLAKEGYFEKLIRELILDNPHKVILTLEPSKTMAAESDKALSDRLADHQKKLSEAELLAIKENESALKAYQAMEDSPEDLAKIPLLKRSDLTREATPFKTAELSVSSDAGKASRLLWHDYFTNGVSYLRFLFDVTDLSDEELFDLSVLKIMLTLVNTEHFSYGKLDNEINLKTGGIQASISVSSDVKDREKITAFFELKAKCFEENTKDAIALVREILFTSDFSDTKRLREVLAETRAGMQASLSSAGHQTASGRALSNLTRGAWISEQLSGIDFLDRLSALLQDYDARKAELSESLSALLKKIRSRAVLWLDFTGKEEGRKLFEQEVKGLLSDIEAENPKGEGLEKAGLGKGFAQAALSENEGIREGFCSSADVCYVCRAGDFTKDGLAYSGAMKVLKVMMGYDYLWQNVRVLGGAYGCMSNFFKSGLAFFVSYRDPNLEKTIEVFENAPDYIRQLSLDEDTLTKYIIGAIASQDMPLTPRAAGARSFAAFVTGWSDADEQKERLEMIDATPADLQTLAGHLAAFLDSRVLCVVGKEKQLESAEGLFDRLRPLCI